MQKINLNGNYRLYTYDFQTAPETPAELAGEYLSATVPGNVELDYLAAGLGADPLFAKNAQEYRSLEWKDFWYVHDFTLSELPSHEVWLHFDGVDTVAEYFLNGVKISAVKIC